MEKEFKAAYGQLNQAQKQAVDTIDGPVLVVAGPGTGKTQLLSVRVANILQNTDTDPNTLLGLTFTNFAATNMRDRLNQLIGPSAHNVMVRTFHSFAAEIMSLYPDYFWNGARLTTAPDAVQLEIIQNILAELPLDNPQAFKFAGNFTALPDVQQALKLSKEAGLTPEKLFAMLKVNEAYIDLLEPQLVEILEKPLSFKKLPELLESTLTLPDQPIDETITPLASLSTVLKEGLRSAIKQDEATNKTAATGKWKRQWVQNIDGQKGMHDERKRNAWWRSLAGVYTTYRDRLHEHGYYDYSDMIIEVITQLEQHSDLLASVQERFMYVLIDEFQDTNAAQFRLAHLVASQPANAGRPNLMAVGDDDQSIFAFNGAELNNMLSFRRAYQNTTVIVLEDNYRSSEAVLKVAEGIITKAEQRLVNREADLSKQLKAVSKPGEGSIEHLAYATREHQLSALARHLKDDWKQANGTTIAVLARNHSGLRDLSNHLNNLDVPIRYEQQNNVLNQPVIQQLCLLAEIVVAISQGDKRSLNHNLASLLQHPAWGIEPFTLWQLAIENFSETDWLSSLLAKNDEKLQDIANWLLWLSEQASHEPLPVMLEYLLGLRASEHLTSPLREYFLASQAIDNIYLESLSAVQVLRDTVQEFVAARLESTTLTDFVRFTRLHRELDRPITDQSWFATGEQAIELMTVHKAKGLEFDKVYVLDAIEDSWRPRRMGRKPPANLPLQPYGEQYDDYVRLLYVAATRAKRSLVFSSYTHDSLGRTLLATPLISHLPPNNQEELSAPPTEILESSLKWPRLQTSNEQALLSHRLENFELSSTALLQFLDVSSGGPQSFLERHLLRLPQLTTPVMAYGTAVHKSLQTAQHQVSQGKLDIKKVLTSFDGYLKQQQLSQSEYQRYLAHGLQTLTSLFKQPGFKLEKNGQAEVSINSVRLGEAVLRGNLDRLDQTSNQLLITDYKTGKPLRSFSARAEATAIKAWRHHNQLLFYTLLTRFSGRYKNIDNIKSQIIYVEAEKPQELILEYLPENSDLKRLERVIQQVWQHIMELNFPDTRHYQSTASGINTFEEDLLAGKI